MLLHGTFQTVPRSHSAKAGNINSLAGLAMQKILHTVHVPGRQLTGTCPTRNQPQPDHAVSDGGVLRAQPLNIKSIGFTCTTDCITRTTGTGTGQCLTCHAIEVVEVGLEEAGGASKWATYVLTYRLR